MPTTKRTLSVRLDPDAERRLEKAARIARQSRGAFLQTAGDQMARKILLEWAIVRYREGAASASELAADSGLAVEEIMAAAGGHGREAALDMFLASCKTVASKHGNPQFLRLGEAAARLVAAESPVK